MRMAAGFTGMMLAASIAVAHAGTTTVTIDNYNFEPAVVTVHPGDTVTWTNHDSIPHTATALDGKSFDSGAIDPGARWSFTFPKAGDYGYRCAIHPDMRGMVIVK